MEFNEVEGDAFSEEEREALNMLFAFIARPGGGVGITRLRHLATGEDHLILVGRETVDGEQAIYALGRLFVDPSVLEEYEYTEVGENNAEGG